MNDFDDDMARGCLENGECLEARWGAGEWSEQQQQEQEQEQEPEGEDMSTAKKDMEDLMYKQSDEWEE